MTRENKLALVVGFGLILFIGILISDHFSVARNQHSANLSSREIADPLVSRTRNEPDLIALKPEPPLPANPIPTLQPADPAVSPAHMSGRGVASGAVESMSPEQRSGVARDINLAQGEPMNQSVLRDVEPVNPQATLAQGGEIAQATLNSTRVEESLPGFVRVDAETAVDIKDIRFHDVRGGESLYAICKQYYGSTELVAALAKFNKMDDASQVRAGRRLLVPTKETLTGKPAAAPQAKPKPPSSSALRNTAVAANTPKPAGKPAKPAVKTYTVKSGDSLSGIAQRMLGDREKWRELARINRGVIDDPDNIRAGTVLKLG